MQMKHKGFTLIELIIVIVILGILAVTAAPRFVNLSGDATIATLHGMEATMKSAMNLVNAKAEIENKTEGSSSIVDDGDTIAIHSGYPTAHWNNSVKFIVGLDDQNFTQSNVVCELEWCGIGNQTTSPGGSSVTGDGRIAKIFPRGYTFQQQCGVVYINPADGSKAQIVLETADCK